MKKVLALVLAMVFMFSATVLAAPGLSGWDNLIHIPDADIGALLEMNEDEIADFIAQVLASQAPGRVEISFRVGDSILSINGVDVEVETPYVVDGVTLVPVRVITEAFGAEVEWVGETRHIIITYQNVELVLQIDNIHVYVNGQQQTLLFQPQLTNGVTMVPLRFISENFGAEVGWDEYTQAITVVKEAFGDTLVDIEDVLRRSTMPMAGDSFLNWSIRRTPDMEVFFRTFDGRFNTFTISSNTYIEVDFFDNVDNESFAAIQVQEMDFARRFTPMGQRVSRTTSGAEFVSTQFRNDALFVERRIFVRPNNDIVHVGITIDSSVGTSERDEYIAILDTFDFVFNATETEDLANVINGMRLFEDRNLGISFHVPAEWRDFSDRNRINYFFLGERVDGGAFVTGAAIEVVSLQGDDSANRWGSEVLADQIRINNPNTHDFTELRTTTIGGTTAFYYQSNRTLSGISFVSRRIFWQYSGYLYSLYITVAADNVGAIQRIVDSISFEAIDSAVVGVIMREPIETEIVFSSVRNASLGFTVDIPATWARLDNNTFFIDERHGIVVLVGQGNDMFTLQSARDIVSEQERSPEYSLVQPVSQIQSSALSSNALRGFTYQFRVTPRDTAEEPFYITSYLINSGNRSYAIIVLIPENRNGEAIQEIIERIIRSFVVN